MIMTNIPRTTRVVYEASESSQFFTPLWLKQAFWRRWGVPSWDPATSESNPLRALRWTTSDGLTQLAAGPHAAADVANMWWNPPYGRGIVEWTEALAWLHHAHPAGQSIALLPCRPGAIWYSNITDRRSLVSCQSLCELRSRITYETEDGIPHPHPARWASCLLYFGPNESKFNRWASKLGIVRPVRHRPKLAAASQSVHPRQLQLVRGGDE